MTRFTATAASPHRHVLAEGPVWVASTNTLLWVDVERGEVLEGVLDGERVSTTRRLEFGETVGAVVRADDGRLLVAARERLVAVAPGTDARTDGPAVVPPGSRRRTNDGTCDPAGRFLIGTLSLDDREGGETLLRLEDDGSLTTVDDDLSLSNGLAFSPDGALLYSTDTVPGIVWVRDYDVATGAVGSRREHLHITDGFPDGLCADARGHLWVAIWGKGEVRSFSPDGTLTDTVAVDAPHISSVAFVGPGLHRLLITTASRDLDETGLQRHPNAGHLFLADVGQTGTPVAAWNGQGIR
ncbi:MAG: SMP-30/gluconolactonase/LRE family protein [Burkholderiaceae bacterium]|nr:SMP-30/gluconolactonase/LRE family protein [Microbacteriaceae bacterium]